MPPGSGGHEVDLSAPAFRAHKASVPIGNGHLGVVALGHFAGGGLDLSAHSSHHTIRRTFAAAALPSVIGGPR
jgi:hypothetical protein